MTRWVYRRSRRDQLLANNAADKYYALMSGREPQAQNVVAPKRERRPSVPGSAPTEKDIQRLVLDYLRHHPKVAWAHRFNSGVMASSYGGRDSYTRFNTCAGFSDIHGLLKGGRALYCETKRPGKRPTEEQASFLRASAHAGALAFVATCVEDAQAALEGAL